MEVSGQSLASFFFLSSFSERDWTDAEGIGIWKRIGDRHVKRRRWKHQPSVLLGINQHRHVVMMSS